MGLIGGIPLIGTALLIFYSTRAAARGTLPRGTGVGIRTAITGHSDAAWVAGHRAAVPCATLLSIVSGALAVALVVAGAMSPPDPGPAVIVLFVLGYGTILVGAWPLVRIANNGALDFCYQQEDADSNVNQQDG